MGEPLWRGSAPGVAVWKFRWCRLENQCGWGGEVACPEGGDGLGQVESSGTFGAAQGERGVPLPGQSLQGASFGGGRAGAAGLFWTRSLDAQAVVLFHLQLPPVLWAPGLTGSILHLPLQADVSQAAQTEHLEPITLFS